MPQNEIVFGFDPLFNPPEDYTCVAYASRVVCFDSGGDLWICSQEITGAHKAREREREAFGLTSPSQAPFPNRIICCGTQSLRKSTLKSLVRWCRPPPLFPRTPPLANKYSTTQHTMITHRKTYPTLQSDIRVVVFVLFFIIFVLLTNQNRVSQLNKKIKINRIL